MPKVRILCISHSDFETPGIIKNWAIDNNYLFQTCKPYLGQDCLAHHNFDFLIVMGGPQSAIELDRHPYLYDELRLIQQAVAMNKKVLGICLGAQLIGVALGAKAEKSPEKEIGVFPITLLPEGTHDPLLEGFPKRLDAVHWHNDMAGETLDSIVLAYSEGCPRQIIKYGPLVYGFQCHLEIEQKGVKQLLAACPMDLQPSVFTQASENFQAQDFASINQYMLKVLNRLSALP